MAKHTFSLNGDIEFKGTYRELDTFVEAVKRLRPVFEAEEQAWEIEGPVRVGDTIEITKIPPGLKHYTEGAHYEVVGVAIGDRPEIIDDEGDRLTVTLSKYRIVARKEEAPASAKPSVKIGDHIVFDEGNAYITAGKAYKVTYIDAGDDPAVIDDDGDEITAGGAAPREYRVITDARELAFAKAGRKLNEFKAGDIVKVTTGYRDIEKGDIGVVTKPDGSDNPGVTVRGIEWYVFCDLIAPAESRVDGE